MSGHRGATVGPAVGQARRSRGGRFPGARRRGPALGRKGKTGRAGSRAPAGGAASRQPSPVLARCALRVRRGSRLSALPAAFRLWLLSFPCPSRPPPLPRGAAAVPGLRKALRCSAAWIEIQLLTFDPVSPALRLARGKQCLLSPRDLPKPGDGVGCDPGLPAAPVKGS